MADNTLAGGKQYVRGDKPAGGGIVVAGLELVESGLLIVDVAPVTEGLICTYRICQAARCGNKLAPTVICVFYNSVSAAVNEVDDIALRVAVVIRGERIVFIIGVVDGNDDSARIVGDTYYLVKPNLYTEP